MTFTTPDKFTTAQLAKMAEWMRHILETRDVDQALEVVEMTLKEIEQYIKTNRSAS